MHPHSVVADGYAITELLGRGGSSSVYRAHQQAFDRDVAVKVLEVDPRDDDVRRRFARECAAAGRVSAHPNIVTILDSGVTQDGRPFLATELCPGGSLAERVRAGGPMPVADVLRIGVKLSGAAATAHGAGILHRDLKPDNVLVTAFGEPALTDFGISTVGGQAPSTTTRGSYTLHHAPPETLSGGQITAAADIYGLCSTLHHLLAGHPPFGAETGVPLSVVVQRVMHEAPPPIARPDMPAALQDILTKGMAKDPAARFESAAALGAALQSVQRSLGQPVTEMVVLPAASVEPALPLPPPPPPASGAAAVSDATVARRSPIAGAAAVAGAAGVAAAAAADRASVVPPPPPPSYGGAAPSASDATVVGGVRALPTPGADAAPAAEEAGHKRRAVLLGVVALLLIAAAIGAFVYVSGKGSSATANSATSTTAAASTTSDSSTTTSLDVATTAVVAATTPPTAAPTTQAGVATRPTTRPTVAPTAPPTTAAPTLAITSIKSNPATYQCASGAGEVTISWTTTEAASVAIGIDNPGIFQDNLPPNGSFTLPYSGCSSGNNNKVTYYVTARGLNGFDNVVRSLVVNATP